MYTVKLTSEGQTRFWTRDTGILVREKLLSDFLNSEEHTLKIDFSDVEIVDYSFASELVAISVSRLAKELAGKHIVLSGMNKSVEENVTVAVEKAQLCVLAIDVPNGCKLIGKCSNSLINTFAMINKLRKTDSLNLAHELDTSVQVVNNRLRVLFELGLIKREETSAPSGGRQYTYYSIIIERP